MLRHLRDANRRKWIQHLDVDPEGTARWIKIVGLFVEAGADVDAVVVADRWDPEISALGVLELLESEYCDTEVSGLRKLVARMKERDKQKA